MHDIQKWDNKSTPITYIIAIERNENTAEYMYKKSMDLNVRKKMILFENDINFILTTLNKLKSDTDYIPSNICSSDKKKLSSLLEKQINLINLDFCNGFYYTNSSNEEQESRKILSEIEKLQRNKSFFLFLTYNVRDTGNAFYENFITQTIDALEQNNMERIEQLKSCFIKEDSANTEQLSLSQKRLKFVIPLTVNKIFNENFNIQCKGQWIYNSGSTTLYNVAFYFTPATPPNACAFPNPKIVRELLNVPLTILKETINITTNLNTITENIVNFSQEF